MPVDIAVRYMSLSFGLSTGMTGMDRTRNIHVARHFGDYGFLSIFATAAVRSDTWSLTKMREK